MATASRPTLTQESEEQVFGKRKRDEKEWKSNKRKIAKGEPFVNRLKNQILERKTGNACTYCMNRVEVCYG